MSEPRFPLVMPQAAQPSRPLKTARLRMALQRRGRLARSSLELLQSIGLDFDYSDGRLFSPCSNFPLELLFVRDDDIPEYVHNQVADLGIVGRNVVEEKGGEVECLESLGFGNCRLEIAVREGGSIETLDDLQGKRIATSHPSILTRYLASRELAAAVVQISGSVEIAPILNVADGICDLVSTGSTLRMNGLRPIGTVLESEAVLIGSPPQLEQEAKGQLIDRLRSRLGSCLPGARNAISDDECSPQRLGGSQERPAAFEQSYRDASGKTRLDCHPLRGCGGSGLGPDRRPHKARRQGYPIGADPDHGLAVKIVNASKLDPYERKGLLRRTPLCDSETIQLCESIFARIRSGGDSALRRFFKTVRWS